MSLLALNSMTVTLGGKPVVRDVSFSAEPGELVGLIGPNGAGKSTLLRAVLQLVPSQGAIDVGGQNVRQLGSVQRARQIAYLAQEREVAWDVPVEMVVALGRHPHRAGFAAPTGDDVRAVENAMAQMDVAAFRHRAATELSGGERARVLIARTLAQDTPLILADEPTAGLDPLHQISLMRQFAKMAASGKTIIASLHDLGLAARWCSRLLLLHEGQLVADGAPGAVLTPPRLRDIYGVEAFFGKTGGLPIVQPIDLATPNRSEIKGHSDDQA